MAVLKLRLMTSGWLRRLTHDECGGTVAELAIIVPFLAVMVAGVTEFGRFFQTYSTLAKATRASARYLSNQTAPYSLDDMTKATNLVVCGKLTTCAAGEELVKEMTAAKVCIEEEPGIPETVRVSIPRVTQNCTNGAGKEPHTFQPIFDIGALLHNDFSMALLPISPSSTMYYVENEEP